MNNMSAMDLVRLVRSKAVSPVELLNAHRDAIARANPAINAICTLAADQALAAARTAEDSVTRERRLGPLPVRRYAPRRLRSVYSAAASRK